MATAINVNTDDGFTAITLSSLVAGPGAIRPAAPFPSRNHPRCAYLACSGRTGSEGDFVAFDSDYALGNSTWFGRTRGHPRAWIGDPRSRGVETT
jgi:hypothetical protein